MEEHLAEEQCVEAEAALVHAEVAVEVLLTGVEGRPEEALEAEGKR